MRNHLAGRWVTLYRCTPDVYDERTQPPAITEFNMAEKGKYIYDWPRPMVTVDAVVFAFGSSGPRVLLVKRRNDPFAGMWAIPGGFVEIDEELEDAVARELEEETGLRDIPLEQMRTIGTCGRDPRGRQITVVYMGIAPDGPTEPKAGDDAARARWFDIDDLPGNMAFDHADVLALAIRNLKARQGGAAPTERRS